LSWALRFQHLFEARRRGFLILPHPEVATYLCRKTEDPDRWVAGMARVRRGM
jgi:hypothetical protein